MLPPAGLFAGRVNLIGGPGVGCGKTSFAKAALLSLRRAGTQCAFVAVGLEGIAARPSFEIGAHSAEAAAHHFEAGKHPSIFFQKGEVFVTAAAYVRMASCLPEIIAVVPGQSALGRLAVVRACRDGSGILVGPENNDNLTWILTHIIEGNYADTIIVDGAMNRITQAAALAQAKLFWALRASRSDYHKIAQKMQHLLRMIRIPLAPAAMDNGLVLGKKIVRVAGPLTSARLASMPAEVDEIVIEDFTKIFLDSQEMTILLRGKKLYVVRALEFGGFSVALRDLDRKIFAKTIGDECAAAVISWDAYRQNSDTEAVSA